MAVSVVGTTEITNTTSTLSAGSVLSGSRTFVGGTDHAAVVFVGTLNDTLAANSDLSAWTVTVGGTAATFVTAQNLGSVDPSAGFWYLMNPGSGSLTVEVTIQDGTRAVVIVAVELDGVDTTTPTSATAAADTDTLSITSAESSSLILSGTAVQGNTGTFTGGAGTDAELYDAKTGTLNFNDVGVAVYSTANSAASTTYTVGGTPSTTNSDASVAVEFAAGVASTPIVVNDATHGHTVDVPALTGSIAPASAGHTQTADVVTVAEVAAGAIVVDDASHGHTADVAAVSPTTILPDSTTHAHTAGVATLVNPVTGIRLVGTLNTTRTIVGSITTAGLAGTLDPERDLVGSLA